MKLSTLFEDSDDLNLTNKDLTTLVGKCPDIVKGDFYCSNNKFTSLEGSPKKVLGSFNCSFNGSLTSLKGGPTEVGRFACNMNNITTLDGAPKKVDGDVACRYNKITSLKDVHKQIHEIRGEIHLDGNPIKSHVLGLLLIKGIKKISLFPGTNHKVEEILNKYLGQGKSGVVKAQRELIENDLDEFAEL